MSGSKSSGPIDLKPLVQFRWKAIHRFLAWQAPATIHSLLSGPGGRGGGV